MEFFGKRRFLIPWILIFVFSVAAGAWRLPAYASRMPLLLLILFIDLGIVCFLAMHSNGGICSKLTILLTLLPSFQLVVFFSSMSFLTPLDWNPVIRTYWLGISFILQISKIFPAITVLLLAFRSRHVIESRRQQKDFRKPLLLSYLLALVIIGIFFHAMAITCCYPEIKKQKIAIQGLKKEFEGYRIVHISDWHLGRFHSTTTIASIVEEINRLQADLVVFTGDLVNYATSECRPYLTYLSSIRASDGVFAVGGNHDYGDYLRWTNLSEKQKNIDDLGKIMDSIGWYWLRNEQALIVRNGSRLVVAGTDYWSPLHRFPHRADFSKALSSITSDDVVVLLTHDPVAWEKQVLRYDYPVDLTLAGHTHAFQFVVSALGHTWSPPSLLKKHWKGLYVEESETGHIRYLYVNAGLGTNLYPGRVGVKPEITVLQLHRP